MTDIGPGQIELKVHGLSQEDHGQVSARVFANKLKQLVGVLEAADKVANGKITHSYVLAGMHMSQPTAVLAEIPIDEEAAQGKSAIPVVNDALEFVKVRGGVSDNLDIVVRKIGLFTARVEQDFGFMEVRTQVASVVRIDSFLRNRAMQARRPPPSPGSRA